MQTQTKFKFFMEIEIGKKFIYGNDCQTFIKINNCLAQAIDQESNFTYRKTFGNWIVVESL